MVVMEPGLELIPPLPSRCRQLDALLCLAVVPWEEEGQGCSPARTFSSTTERRETRSDVWFSLCVLFLFFVFTSGAGNRV